jgi:hypothetical protein
MGIRITGRYLLGFLALIFFVHECHDWAHFIAARIICDCWGLKSFDNWTLCSDCTASSHLQVWIWFAGPLVTYFIVWLGWWLMSRDKTTSQQSLGFCLVFAAIPFARILAAATGGGDETFGLRQLFQHDDKSNSRTVALSALLLVLLLTLPALLKALMRLRDWKERLILFPIFLVLPLLIDKWVYAGLNKLSSTGFLGYESLPGVSILVLGWSLLLLVLLLLTYKSLLFFLQPWRQGRTRQRI